MAVAFALIVAPLVGARPGRQRIWSALRTPDNCGGKSLRFGSLMVQLPLDSVPWYGMYADGVVDAIRDMTIGKAAAKIKKKRRISNTRITGRICAQVTNTQGGLLWARQGRAAP